MNLVALSDIHSSLEHLGRAAEDIRNADLVLISGDITNFGGYQEAEEVLGVIANFNENIFAVPGNCDSKSVNSYLEKHNMNLHCRCRHFNGIYLIGQSCFHECNHETGSELSNMVISSCLDNSFLRVPENAPFILVTHPPAYGTKIDTVSGRSCGSQEIRRFIMKTGPVLALAGHIHDAAGKDRLNDTVLVNPGSFRSGCYARISMKNRKIESQLIRL